MGNGAVPPQLNSLYRNDLFENKVRWIKRRKVAYQQFNEVRYYYYFLTLGRYIPEGV